MARYFEDFAAGEVFLTQGRTVTETDLMMYAYLSGDHNPLHVDAEFARATPWGQRLIYGPLVTLIAAGLRTRLGLLEGTALALLGMECRYGKPTFVGDTLTVRVSVAETRPSRRDDRGIVVFALAVLNQHGEVVQEGSVTQLVRRRPEEQQ